MKYFSLLVLALLLVSGVAFAAGIPVSVDPQNGPEVWTQEVFNDSGSTLTSGLIVVWDYTDSDMTELANRKMYITTTTTVDDVAVAGITVDPTCPDQTVCTIAIYGPVKARVTGTVTAGVVLSTSATAGTVGNYSNTSSDDGAIGWSIQASTAGEVEGGTNIATIFVNPSVVAE